MLNRRFPDRTRGPGSPDRVKARLEAQKIPATTVRTKPDIDWEEYPIDAADEANRQDYGAALRAMVARDFIGTARQKAQAWRAYRVGCHPDLVEFEKRLIRRFEKLGVPLFAVEMMRNPERQTELFVKGLSRAKAGQSPHQYGLAVDIVHGLRAWNIDKKSWDIIGHIGKEISLQSGIPVTWGGDWKFWDPAHWELKNWRTMTELYPFDLGLPGSRRKA